MRQIAPATIVSVFVTRQAKEKIGREPAKIALYLLIQTLDGDAGKFRQVE